jgi:hypothetical protein
MKHFLIIFTWFLLGSLVSALASAEVPMVTCERAYTSSFWYNSGAAQ